MEWKGSWQREGAVNAATLERIADRMKMKVCMQFQKILILHFSYSSEIRRRNQEYKEVTLLKSCYLEMALY